MLFDKVIPPVEISTRPKGIYVDYVKRVLDVVCSLIAIVCLSWLFVIVAILVRVKLGSPVLFNQFRPGAIDAETGQEKIFVLYKFRTMTDECDSEGNLLSDDARLTKFGKMLRSTSLDELPELFNILRGDMSVIGPRPQLVRDMVFMSVQQRRRHLVRPGLSGLAQVRGRNEISWDGKLVSDLEYLEKVSFICDATLVIKTIGKVFKREGISSEGMETALDFGDDLLKRAAIDKNLYDSRLALADRLISEVEK